MKEKLDLAKNRVAAALNALKTVSTRRENRRLQFHPIPHDSIPARKLHANHANEGSRVSIHSLKNLMCASTQEKFSWQVHWQLSLIHGKRNKK